MIVAGAGAAQKFNFPLRDGAAYVFQFDGIDWVETDQLHAPDGFDQERFGDAVAVSGTNVLVGARRDRNSNGAAAKEQARSLRLRGRARRPGDQHLHRRSGFLVGRSGQLVVRFGSGHR